MSVEILYMLFFTASLHVRTVQPSLKAGLKAGRIILLPSEEIITALTTLQASNGHLRLEDHESNSKPAPKRSHSSSPGTKPEGIDIGNWVAHCNSTAFETPEDDSAEVGGYASMARSLEDVMNVKQGAKETPASLHKHNPKRKLTVVLLYDPLDLHKLGKKVVIFCEPGGTVPLAYPTMVGSRPASLHLTGQSAFMILIVRVLFDAVALGLWRDANPARAHSDSALSAWGCQKSESSGIPKSDAFGSDPGCLRRFPTAAATFPAQSLIHCVRLFD
ncbi:hypothetical protein CPB85DRAFT_1255617 [Mucidula mucida]|nr:hypothetical protein CPB85DRAFT_1255617 [Mucidula mucida]